MTRFLLFLLILSPFLTSAQQFGLRNYSAADGLAQSQVFAMLEDRRGFLWLGTRGGGLSRFDGLEFVNYTSREGLINNYLWALQEDGQGDIWVGTDNGLSRWNGREFTNFSLSDSSRNPVYCIQEDSTGTLWFGTGQGLYFLQRDSVLSIVPDSAFIGQEIRSLYQDGYGRQWIGGNGNIWMRNRDSLQQFSRQQGIPPNKFIWDFCEDGQGNLWAATYGAGLLSLPSEGKRFQRRMNQDALFRGLLFDLHPDQKGRIWIATQNTGAVIFDPVANTIQQLTENNGLPSNYVRTILQDSWSNIWLGTSGGGIVKYFGQQFTHVDQDEGLPGRAVYSVLEDQNCDIWMGTGAKGITVMGGDSLRFYDQSNGFTNRKVKALMEDSQGRIWAGTDGEGIAIFKDSVIMRLSTIHGLGDNWIRDILEDQNGDFWLATTGNGLTRIRWRSDRTTIRKDQIKILNTTRGMPQNHVNCLHQDRKGRIWFGMANQGIGFLDKKGKISQLTLPGGYTDNQVRCMVEDDYGYLWVGTAGGSLKRVFLYSDSTDFPIETFSEGLTSTNIYLLGLDSYQQLWIGTEKGVERATLGPERQIIDLRAFGRAEGFVGIEACQNAFFRDRGDHLWFGTVNGLTQFLPEQREETNRPPTLRLTHVRLTYENLEDTRFADQVGPWFQVAGPLKLKYFENHLGFDFEGVHQQTPEKIRYQWQLEGYEEEWSRLRPATSATYANLNPGKYQFKVRACTLDQTCSEVQTFSFEILPPLWQVLWFQLLMAALLLGIILLVFRLRLNQVRRTAAAERDRLEMEKDLLRLEQKSLGLQMNPHFMFNALNSIQALITDNDAKTARYYLAKFARLMRLVLDNSRETFIPLHQEIQTLDIYLAIEQFSREQAFSYSLELAADLDPEEILIPPLLIQPFVENAIIHGIAHRSSPGNIQVEFRRQEEWLECIISDDGIGRKKAKTIRSQQSHTHKSTGLEVTQERLDILRQGQTGDQTRSIEFIDLTNEKGEPAGTRVVVRLPMQEEWE